MADAAKIKLARERTTKAVSLRPSIGQGTSVTRARVTEGYRCEISEGPWTLVADMPKSEGGEDQGPTPGVLGRGALASCYAMGIVGLAVERDIPLHELSVEVHADWDMRGSMGLDEEIIPGYSQIRILIEIESSASEDAIQDLISDSERLSPYVDVFRRANKVVTESKITRNVSE